MPSQTDQWTVEEAKSNLLDLLEAVRTNGPQTIADPLKQGRFIVSFASTESKPSTVKFLLEDSAE